MTPRIHNSRRTPAERFGNLRVEQQPINRPRSRIMTSAQTVTEPVQTGVSFDEQIRQARALVGEGRRLLHMANRDLRTGNVLVRRSHQRLTDTEAYFRRTMAR
jgi:hypothetical protein